ncbi:MAG TPA: SDR family oxidoreductase [Actinomycetota bacterium]|nr:SDR family oxidoreductase [Actinomycetota bacterium]
MTAPDPSRPAAGRPLAGRVALVTGVSRRVGIGLAVARRLAALGAGLFVTSWTAHDREQPWGADPGGLDAVLAELGGGDAPGVGRVEHLEADFQDPEAPDRVMAAAVQAFGHVDVLVCNHARSSAGGLGELTAAELDATLAVNTRAVLLLVQAFAARHDGRPGGRVVLFSSGQHLGPMPGELAYAASKGALAEVTASLADALADRGITVNTINPGPTDTDYVDQATRERVARRFPAGRWGAPDDAARLVAWLCTDDAAWVTGQVINSEGGFRRFG